MINNVIAASPRKAARVAAIWYVLVSVFSIFGMLYSDSRFYVAGDAAATADRILAEGRLFRLGITSTLAGQVCQIFAGLALYRLFESVNRNRAKSLLALVVAMVPIAFLNMLNMFAPLILLGDAAFLKAFEPAQLQAVAMLFFELQKYGVLIAGVFWGLWLFPLGLLVFESGFFPKFLGVLLVIGCVGYILESLSAFVFPDAGPLVSTIANALAVGGELPFLLWLAIRGARNRTQSNPAPEPV
ncbi:MAG: DUF4386 domain-containing protein [Spirochaetota bacterium]